MGRESDPVRRCLADSNSNNFLLHQQHNFEGNQLRNNQPPRSSNLILVRIQTAPPESTTIAQPPSLSTAAQAGIGVGAAFLALALAAVAFLLFKLRNKKAQLARLQQEQHQHQGGAGADYDSAQLEGKVDTIARYQHPYEVDGRGARFELGTDSGTTAGRGW